MTLMGISAVLLACVVGLVTFFLTRNGAAGEIEAVKDELSATQLALSNAKIDFEARQQELRSSIDEARTREGGNSQSRRCGQAFAPDIRRIEGCFRREGPVSRRSRPPRRNEIATC